MARPSRSPLRQARSARCGVLMNIIDRNTFEAGTAYHVPIYRSSEIAQADLAYALSVFPAFG